jgi:hypothetical protein
MLAPGHSGVHQSVVMADGQVGLVTWLSPEITWLPQESGAAGVSAPSPTTSASAAALTARAAPEPVVYAEATITIEPGRGDIVGRKRTRALLNEPYAALDEGIHMSWDLSGHEIERLPMLDEEME